MINNSNIISIQINDGCVILNTSSGQQCLNATVIYSVIFENILKVNNSPVSKIDFFNTGFLFSEYSAEPVLILELKDGIVTCQLYGVYEGKKGLAGIFDKQFVDYVFIENTWYPLPSGTLKILNTLFNNLEISDRTNILLSQYLKILRTENFPITIIDKTEQTFYALKISEQLKGDLPDSFKGKLYPYQLNGYRWLTYMTANGLGAIIADEMGLGKTVQIICLLLNHNKRANNPSLVLCPATLLENWKREINRFAPELNILIHSGYNRTGFSDIFRKYDIIISSFDTAVSDISLFRCIKFELVIIDEAQGIKNPETKRRNQLKTLKRKLSICVTGTPVENHLSDLWSLIDFISPSFLGSFADFTKQFPDSTDAARRLESIVSPMILRRTVKQVASDLPERIDIPQALELDSKSAEVYENLRNEVLNQGKAVLSSLINLRMFCVHPWLCNIFTENDDPAVCSVKFHRMLQIIEEIFEIGSKVIIFTSFQKSIDLLKSEIIRRFFVWSDCIDGRTSVQNRQNIVDNFSSVSGAAALILNPKAAGTGLNITSANHIIHYNLEWNPAVEDQASARAYRRGQTKTVTVHRFFYVNTVEEIINDRMFNKRMLASNAVVGTDVINFDEKDILKALRISPVKKIKN